MNLARAWLCIFVLMVSASPVFADTGKQNAVDIKLTQNKVEVIDGKDKLVAVEKIAPGDVIQYEATYHNVTQHAVQGLKADLPIPKNTQYVKQSARPGNVLASTDGAAFAPTPLKQKIRNANGVIEERDVPLAEYRHLRWDLGELSGGKSVTVVARVRVDALPESKTGAVGQ